MRASKSRRRSVSAVGRTGLVWGVALAACVALFGGTAAGADPRTGNGGTGKGKGQGAAQSAEHSNSAQHQTEGTSGTSGDPSEPQPRSNADQNGTGANTSGPYDSTRDGSPSGNGNGEGQATGQPCAGCVGNADNKNPPGQLPGPRDPNNGYECDDNSGIARSNPAHTGCINRATAPPEPGGPGNPIGPLQLADLPLQLADPVPAGAALARTGWEGVDWATFGIKVLAAGLVLMALSRERQRRFS